MPISRRLLIEVEPTIVSIFPKSDNDHSGFGDTSFVTRVMLMETRNTTLLSLLDVKIPTGNEDLGLGSGMTTISPGIGMWRDIGGHFALHSFLGLDIPAGGKSDKDPDTTVNYGAALTKTVTPKDTPFFGNLTFFIEFNGSSDMGINDDTTVVSILPGARWNLGHDFWLMPGIEFPITGHDEFDNRIWYGIRPAVLAIIINAVYKFGKKALKNWQLGIIGAAVMIASLAGMSEVLVLIAGVLFGMFWLSFGQKRNSVKASFFPSFLLSAKPEFQIFFISLKRGLVRCYSGIPVLNLLNDSLFE